MALILENISLAIERNLILEQISFEVPIGQVLVILGNSGAGKSKLLEVVAGLIGNQSGKIIFGEEDLSQLTPQARKIGFVFQDYALFPHMTAAKNILFGLKSRQAPTTEQKRWLKLVAAELKIDHLLSRFPAELSGGQQQRVALARCMVLRPEILLLDEPLSALDAASRERLVMLMKKIQKKYRVTMLYVTHDHNEARFMGDQIMVVDQGRVIQTGPPEEIFARPVSRFVAHFTATRNILPGRIQEHLEAGQALVEVAGSLLLSTSCQVASQDVWVCIRPEHFSFVDETASASPISSISDDPVAAESAQTTDNIISGYRISQILPQSGATVLIELMNRGARLLVFASNRRVVEQNLNVGSQVEILVAAEHVHCLPRQPDDIYCRPE
ncbi:MAG: spermidine/putrescine ABC transporter ATP-binding protein [Deltaproteobacteria bacterium]|nr:MAG: spermidine/putrescine ABC transporter ATP-binding protein [Deltaproteobacteria bacterium]